MAFGYDEEEAGQFIDVLKFIAFLNETGRPTRNYFEFLDRKRSKALLHKCLQKSYAELFRVDPKAYRSEMARLVEFFRADLEIGDRQAIAKAACFLELCEFADFGSGLPAENSGRFSFGREYAVLKMVWRELGRPRRITVIALGMALMVVLASMSLPLPIRNTAQPEITLVNAGWNGTGYPLKVSSDRCGYYGPNRTTFTWSFTLKNDGHADGLAMVAFFLNGSIAATYGYYVPHNSSVNETAIVYAHNCAWYTPSLALTSVSKIH